MSKGHVVAAGVLIVIAVTWPCRPSRAQDARTARLVIGRPSIRGSMPREWYLRHVVRHRPRMERCLERQRSPRVAVVVRIVIGPTGRVTAANLASGSLAPAPLRCLLDELRSVDFGSHPAGIDVIDQPLTYVAPAPLVP